MFCKHLKETMYEIMLLSPSACSVYISDVYLIPDVPTASATRATARSLGLPTDSTAPLPLAGEVPHDPKISIQLTRIYTVHHTVIHGYHCVKYVKLFPPHSASACLFSQRRDHRSLPMKQYIFPLCLWLNGFNPENPFTNFTISKIQIPYLAVRLYLICILIIILPEE